MKAAVDADWDEEYLDRISPGLEEMTTYKWVVEGTGDLRE